MEFGFYHCLSGGVQSHQALRSLVRYVRCASVVFGEQAHWKYEADSDGVWGSLNVAENFSQNVRVTGIN